MKLNVLQGQQGGAADCVRPDSSHPSTQKAVEQDEQSRVEQPPSADDVPHVEHRVDVPPAQVGPSFQRQPQQRERTSKRSRKNNPTNIKRDLISCYFFQHGEGRGRSSSLD